MIYATYPVVMVGFRTGMHPEIYYAAPEVTGDLRVVYTMPVNGYIPDDTILGPLRNTLILST